MKNLVLGLSLGFTLALQASATQELTPETYQAFVESGQNGMVKFFQPWCGHCTAMKPDWDKLAEEAHPSVFIADVHCGDQDELCGEVGVQGYPTIKVFKDGEMEDYRGGRGFDDLMEYVDENLALKCDIADESSCSEKAIKYIAKWKGKDQSAVSKERTRLDRMKGKTMAPDLKKWLVERLAILKQLDTSEGQEL